MWRGDTLLRPRWLVGQSGFRTGHCSILGFEMSREFSRIRSVGGPKTSRMPGFPGQPVSRADVEQKFRSSVGKRLPPERIDAVLAALWGLDRTDDVSALLNKLALET